MTAARLSGRAVLLGSAVLVAAILATAPRLPAGWDAVALWTDRAEAEREDPGALVHMMQTPADWPLLLTIIGLHTYPIGHPMITGAIARWLPADVSARRAGDLWLGVVWMTLLTLLACSPLRVATAQDAWPVPLALFAPFVVVHLRAGYVDLLAGALAALAAVLAVRALRVPSVARWTAWVIVATVLCQTKQEGVVLLLAGTLTATLMEAQCDRRAWRWLALQVGVAVVNVAGWWLVMRSLFGPDMPAGVRNVAGLQFTHGALFFRELVRHGLDVASWGIAWPVLAGIAMVKRRVWWAVNVCLLVVAQAMVHVVGPSSMLDYVVQGTLMNRLLLQTLVASLPFALPFEAPDRRTDRQLSHREGLSAIHLST